MRSNDINQQMRTMAAQLKPGEMNAVSAWYGANDAVPEARN